MSAVLEAVAAEPTTTIAADLAVIAAQDRQWDANWLLNGVKQAADAIPDRIAPRHAMHILKRVMQQLDGEFGDFQSHLDEAIAGLDVQVAREALGEVEKAYGLLAHPNVCGG